jgi:HEAT repeat protein
MRSLAAAMPELPLMNRSRLRPVLLVLLLLAVCGVAYLDEGLIPWAEPSAEGLTRNLESSWAFRRREAAAGLGRFTNEADRVIPSLVKALYDKDAEVRKNALESLRALGNLPESVSPQLLDLIQASDDPAVRRHAATFLAYSKQAGVGPALVRALDDPDAGVRQAAVLALSIQKASPDPGPAIDKLLAMLASTPPDEMRAALVQTLPAVGGGQERVVRALADLAAKDPNAQVRNDAVYQMRKTDIGFEIPTMIAALEDQNSQVRLTAAAGLAMIGWRDDRTVPALCKAAIKADEVTREGMGVNIALLKFQNAERGLSPEMIRRITAAVHELKALLEHKEAAGREAAVTVLSRIVAVQQFLTMAALLEPAREALDAILARLADEGESGPLRMHVMSQWSVLQTALVGRGRAPVVAQEGSPSSGSFHPVAAWIASLAKLLESSSDSVRGRSAEILLEAVNQPQAEEWSRDAWRKAVPDLARAAASKDSKVRDGALTLLSRLGPEAKGAEEALASLAKDSQDTSVRASAEAALRAVTSTDGLRSKDAATRIAAARALGSLGWRAKEAMPNLIEAIKDPEVEVRRAAAEGLWALGKEADSAVTALATAAKDDSDATVRVTALGALDAIAPGTRPVLDAHLAAMRDRDPMVRAAAASFPKVPDDDSLAAALESALGDADEAVRRSAATSLLKVMFQRQGVLARLVASMGDEKRRATVVDAVAKHLEKVRVTADFVAVRDDLPRLRSVLEPAIPTLKEGMGLADPGARYAVGGLLARIVGFARPSRNADFQKALEPAVQALLSGLSDTSPDVRFLVLDEVGAVPIGRATIVSALVKTLEKPDLDAEEQQAAIEAVGAQARAAGSDPAPGEALKPAVPLLVKALSSPADGVRGAAAKALGQMGELAGPAEDALRTLAGKDAQPQIRKSAEDALKAVTEGAKKGPPGGGRRF